MAPHTSRDRHMLVFLALAFGGLMLRLVTLQVIEADALRKRSDTNAVQVVPIDALRGRVLDRYGEILVGNRASYSVAITASQLKDTDSTIERLAGLLGIPAQRIKDSIPKRYMARNRPVVIKRDVPFAIVAQIEENRDALPGVIYLTESRRRYPHGKLASHVVGYVRQVSKSQRQAGYALGDLIGQSGVEVIYESTLRGRKGVEYREVTSSGRITNRSTEDPVRGTDIRLSLDQSLQRVTENAFHDTLIGAAVAMDPQTGEILALVSRPAYDPRDLTGVLTPATWRRLNDDPARPLFNRVVSGTYPPGSTAKMITALAALEGGIATPETTLEPCTGVWQLGRREFACWRKSGHGTLTLVNAIQASCNIFFYQLGAAVGMEQWASMAALFQFGQPSAIDLPNEASGQFASPQLLDNIHGEGTWTEGEMLNAAIGQGPTVVTPIQMVLYVSALATGFLVKPHLVVETIDSQGISHSVAEEEPHILPLSETFLDSIRHAMQLVTEGPIGTARRSRVWGYHVAGKTGTAQNPHGDDHSWYVGFAPAENPTIAVAVIGENAGHGSSVAAPIAGKIFRAHLRSVEARRNEIDQLSSLKTD